MSGVTPRRVLVCGSRDWTNGKAIEEAILRYVKWAKPDEITIIHGGSSGAEATASFVARHAGLKEEIYWADWVNHGPNAMFLRNQAMADSKPDVCIAFPDLESRDVWDLVNRCNQSGIPVVVF